MHIARREVRDAPQDAPQGWEGSGGEEAASSVTVATPSLTLAVIKSTALRAGGSWTEMDQGSPGSLEAVEGLPSPQGFLLYLSPIVLSDMTEDFTLLHFPFFKNGKCEKQSEIGAVRILHCRVSELGFRCRICSQSWLGELQVGAEGA